MSDTKKQKPLDLNDEIFDLIFENFLEVNKLTNEYAKILDTYPKYAETYRSIYGNLSKQTKRQTELIRNSLLEKKSEESNGISFNSSSTFNKALLSLKKELLKSSL